MTLIQIRSIEAPFDEPVLARKAVTTLSLAEAMGLLPPGEILDSLDPDSFLRVMDQIAGTGIGRSTAVELAHLEGQTPDRLARLLHDLELAMEDSPVPDREWPALEVIFGVEALASLVGVAPSSLRRYRSGSRPTPDPVAARLHFLALVVADLLGSYNEVGVRRWFERSRGALEGNRPTDLLEGDWDPDDDGPRRVRELSRSLTATTAT